MTTSSELLLVEDPILEIIDLDNTLANTPELQAVLESLLERHGINAEAMREAREQTRGFDTVKYLREVAGANDQEINEIHEAFTAIVEHEGRERFFRPDAEKALETIDRMGKLALILTTGGDEWQYWKLKALGIERRPFHITDTPEKSLLISQGFNPSTGLYELEDVDNLPKGYTGLAFKNFRLVDDNLLAFDAMPADSFGLHVSNTDTEWYRSCVRDYKSGRVMPIRGLKRYIEKLQGR